MTVSETYLRLVSHIAEIAKACGRDSKEITLIAVSKEHPWETVEPAYISGCRHFGENRLQEALIKMEQAPQDIHWHLIGSLQKNKVRKAVGKFSLIHSVDSFELAEKLSSCSQEANFTSSILLQVNTSQEATKHGLSESEWEEKIEELIKLQALNIKGLMTMAPFTEDQKAIRHCFSSLRQMQERLKPHFSSEFQHLSMGMSHDYEIAIEEGATLLRVGTAIFSDSL